MLALAAVLSLSTAISGGCYYVSNTRIVRLPRCDFSPRAIDALRAEEPPPATRPGYDAGPYGVRPWQGSGRDWQRDGDGGARRWARPAR